MHQVQDKIAPVVNEAIKLLESSKLIAVPINDQMILCKLLPCHAINVTIESSDQGTYLLYEHFNKKSKQ